MYNTVLYLATLLTFANPYQSTPVSANADRSFYEAKIDSVLASRTISLNERYNTPSVNEVFRDNILLTLGYLSGEIANKENIAWNKVENPQKVAFFLNPGEVFAFHDQILSNYKGKTIKTTNAHFNSQEGFKSDGYLFGDGVCHLASLMYWAATEAKLTAYAPTNHNFAKINQIPSEFGVSIYDLPGSPDLGSIQNLYITNNQNYTVSFVFTYDGDNLTLDVLRVN